MHDGKNARPDFRDFLPKRVWPDRPRSLVFFLSGLCAFTAFGIFGLYAAMVPVFLKDVLSGDGLFVRGTSIAMILFLSAGRVPSR